MTNTKDAPNANEVVEHAQSLAEPNPTPLVLHLPGGARVEIIERMIAAGRLGRD
jgi:hypothetical protein